jgi:hypothetical protein
VAALPGRRRCGPSVPEGIEPSASFPQFEAFFVEVFEIFRTREAWEPVPGSAGGAYHRYRLLTVPHGAASIARVHATGSTLVIVITQPNLLSKAVTRPHRPAFAHAQYPTDMSFCVASGDLEVCLDLGGTLLLDLACPTWAWESYYGRMAWNPLRYVGPITIEVEARRTAERASRSTSSTSRSSIDRRISAIVRAPGTCSWSSGEASRATPKKPPSHFPCRWRSVTPTSPRLLV